VSLSSVDIRQPAAGRGKGLLEAGIDSEPEGETVALVERLRNVVNRFRSTDPYHDECTVCGRAFQSAESSCPECGGEVERVSGPFDSTAVDSSP
jgi:lipopolysaccharide biosynthesis regulator YciM